MKFQQQAFRIVVFACLLITACKTKEAADLILINGKVYTVDSSFSTSEAIAIKNGKILATGSSATIQSSYQTDSLVDLKGAFVYPGFIDAHAHFVEYALGLQTANLTGTESWDAILKIVQENASKITTGWIVGRGWDQNDWANKNFPDNTELDRLFPDRPVFLTRVDGHAAIANKVALDLAGVTINTKLTGGDVQSSNGKLTGILIDNAVNLVASKIPGPSKDDAIAGLLEAQKNCFAAGLTTVDDCGLDYSVVQAIDSLQKTGTLNMRIYAMLSDSKENFDAAFSKGKIKTDFLNVRSFKVYADGALGSRGACLLQPYADKPDWQGFLLSNPSHFDSVANIISKNGWQMCTHAIGDSGNRTILNIYAKYLSPSNDQRWRIEHAQVINPKDFALFKQYAIIPSVQPTHATSDMYWAKERLGAERVKGAYAYKELMNENGWIPLGTDFPVEDISPLKTFYAAVVRKDAKGWPAEGFQMENALTREQAIRGMTIWAAKSNFEEKEKGSLQTGKFADFVILDKDLMTTGEKELLNVKVTATYISGKKVTN